MDGTSWHKIWKKKTIFNYRVGKKVVSVLDSVLIETILATTECGKQSL